MHAVWRRLCSSGFVDKNEFKFLHKMIVDAHAEHAAKVAKAKEEEERQRKSASQARKLLVVAIVLIFLLLAGMGGLMVAVTSAYKDTKSATTADGQPVLATMQGKVIETSPASVQLPLVAAPAMDIKRLAKVSSLSVSLYVLNGNLPPFLNVSAIAAKVRATPC